MGLNVHFYAKERYKDIVLEPQPAENMFPEWFARLEKKSTSKCPFAFVYENNPYHIVPKREGQGSNLKGCPGILDFLKQGYVIPAWDNFIFRDDGNGSLVVNWTDECFDTEYKTHGNQQFHTMDQSQLPVYGHWGKIFTPWIIKTDPGVSCLITHPVWHRNKNFTTATGVVHTDQTPIHLAWFFEWNYRVQSGLDLNSMNLQEQIIERGTPISLIIPFYRKQYKSKVEYISESEYDRLGHMQDYRTHSLRNTDLYQQFRRSLGRLFK